MKIALINPKGAFLSTNPEFADFWNNSKELSTYRHHWTGFSLGLLVIAALTPKDFDVEFIDENFDSIDFEKGYDIVALSGMTQQATRIYQIADEFRKRKTKVVIGGIHATVMPEEAKEHADSVIIGEGEELWPQFLEDLCKDREKPFYKAERAVDLAKSPIPRYELLNSQNYGLVWVNTTRGCPHDCMFCSSSRIYGYKYRQKNVDQVLAEIDKVKMICKNTMIAFADDNMFIDKKYSKELIKRLIPLNISWYAQTDVSVAKDENFLKMLKEAGCFFLFIGFESVSKESLRNLDSSNFKFRQLDNYSEVVRKIQSCGIGVMGAFIIGFDSDDKSTFREIADFIIESHLYGASITILTPLPGTQLREKLEKEKRIISNNWENYTLFNVNFIPKQMTSQELQDGLLEIYKRVYNKEVQLNISKYFKKIYIDIIKNQGS